MAEIILPPPPPSPGPPESDKYMVYGYALTDEDMYYIGARLDIPEVMINNFPLVPLEDLADETGLLEWGLHPEENYSVDDDSSYYLLPLATNFDNNTRELPPQEILDRIDQVLPEGKIRAWYLVTEEETIFGMVSRYEGDFL